MRDILQLLIDDIYNTIEELATEFQYEVEDLEKEFYRILSKKRIQKGGE